MVKKKIKKILIFAIFLNFGSSFSIEIFAFSCKFRSNKQDLGEIQGFLKRKSKNASIYCQKYFFENLDFCVVFFKKNNVKLVLIIKMLNGQLFQFCFQFWTQLDELQTWIYLEVSGTLSVDWENEKVEIPFCLSTRVRGRSRGSGVILGVRNRAFLARRRKVCFFEETVRAIGSNVFNLKFCKKCCLGRFPSCSYSRERVSPCFL